MRTLYQKIFVVILLCIITALGLKAQTATITTDLPDYAPGTTATLTGSGFQANEVVTMQVLHADGTPATGTDHDPWYVTADSAGNFVTTWYVCEDDCVGSTLRATADGQSSGLHAEVVFTDAAGGGTMTVLPTNVCGGSSGNSLTFTFARANGTPNIYPAGSQVTIVVPVGWTIPQNTTAASPGFVSVSATGGASTPSIASITGTGPWTITINFTSTINGQGFTLIYAGGGTLVTATSAGAFTFTTQTKIATGGFVSITTQPVVTVNPLPAAPSSVTVTPATICAGDISNLKATSAGNTIRWYTVTSGGTTIGTSASGANFAVTPAVTTTYYAEAFSAAECPSSTRTSVTVTVNPLPSATTSVTATPSAICAGSTSNLNATSAGNTIRWYTVASGGTTIGTSASGANFPVTPSGTTTYYAEAFSAAECPSSTRTSVTVTVNPLPAAPSSVAATPATICAGSTSNLNATSAGNTIRWYTVASGGTTIGTSASGANFSVSPSGTTTYYAEALTGPGCMSATRTSVTVTVNPLPAAPTSVTATPAEICAGSSSNLNATSVGNTIRWYIVVTGGTTIGTSASGANFAVTPPGTTTYYAEALTGGPGCISATRTPVTVTVNILPALFIVTGGGSYCSGGTGVAIGLSGSQTDVNYQLKNGASNVGSPVAGTGSTISFGNQATAGTYTVVATDAATNCTRNMSGSVTVSINPIPDADVSIDITEPSTICSGSSTTIHFKGTNDATITYNKNEVLQPSITLNSGGNFNLGTGPLTANTTYDIVSVTSTDGCVRNTGFTPGSVTVTVNQPPSITATNLGPINNTTNTCGTSVTMGGNLTITGTAPITTVYSLSSGGTAISNPYTFPVGITTVYANATNTCGSDDETFTVTVVDNQAPVITCPASVIISCHDLTTVAANGSATATDNCDPTPTITSTDVSTQSGGVNDASYYNYTITRTWKAVDAISNSSTCDQVITVQDITAPVIASCAPSVTVAPNNTGCTAILLDYTTSVTATDNCSPVVLSQSPAVGTALALGSNTITITATDAMGNSSTCNFTVNVVKTLVASCSTNNPILYYGYSGDQSSTITAYATFGVAPYTITFTMNRELKCNSVTSAGDELWTGGTGTTSSNVNVLCPGSGSFGVGQFPSSTGTISASGGAYSINISLMADATITATITDANGCISICSTFIHATDVRCFAGNSGNAKVTMCHQTGSTRNPCIKICVDENAVAEHKAHGDFVGECTPNCVMPAQLVLSAPVIFGAQDDILDVKIMPNPTTSYFNVVIKGKHESPVTLRVLDIYGRVIQIKNNVGTNATFQVGQKFGGGTYFIEAIQGKERKIVKMIKVN